MRNNTSRPASTGRGGSSATYKRGRSRPFSSSSRPNSSRGRFGRSGGGRRPKKSTLDISSFINKAVVTQEETKHFVPKHTFADFGLNKTMTETLAKCGYEAPTPIQDTFIPHALQGEDVVGLANTGTGKTAAFLIPLIHKLAEKKDEQVLILTPTRELALQIEREFRIFSEKLGLSSTICVGGTRIEPQIRALKRHTHFVIGTPGRIIDLMKRRVLSFDAVSGVVLDEADRMLDMGFINDIRFILGKTPKERQTLCLSATMSKTIEALINDFLKDPITVSVKTQATSKNIEQDIVKVRGLNKEDMLYDLLKTPEFTKVLVFGRTKHGVEKLSRVLVQRGIKAESIHGNKSHIQRQRALKNFKEDRVQVLVATDVAARGLDIDSVTHVINYEIPETYDDYIHRIGRTGRGSKTGKALTFVE